MGKTKGMLAQFNLGFDNEAGGSAVAEPASTGVAGGGSPSSQPGAGAPASVSPSGASTGTSNGGDDATPRTYRDEDVQRIVRERLAEEQRKWEPYKQFGSPSELKARQDRLERYEQAFRGEAPKITPEEKELRELLTKQFPGIDKVQDLEAKLQAMEQANHAAHAQTGRGLIARLATEKLGTSDPNVLKMLENVISASIASDKDSLAAWNSGDTGVIAKHFESALTQSFDPLFKSASARYAAGKAKDKAEVPPTMPKGGTQAPTSTDRKMSGEERREAAWKRLNELEGQ